MFVLHSSKTHWFDVKPQIVKINGSRKGAIKNNEICPFSLLKQYVHVRGKRHNEDEREMEAQYNQNMLGKY